MSNYSLEVISHHPTFKNKSLRKYYVDGIDTVGAWGDEPFEIKFTNHTWQKVQVKISVDGTDVLTGETATTAATEKMWVVNGYGTLSLKAWPENNNGGAQLVFTSANNSVAIHTHGDMSSRGIIAVAVYTEGHVEPTRIRHDYYHHYDYWTRPYYIGDVILGSSCGGLGGTLSNSTYTSNSIAPTAAGGTSNTFSLNNAGMNSCDASYSANASAADSRGETKGLESLAAVGAGQHVDQKISYVQGLIKPTFTETVRVRYIWWDDLVSKLRQNNYPMPHASGFPADNQTNISLGNTPRIGNYGTAFPREKQAAQPVQSYLRV